MFSNLINNVGSFSFQFENPGNRPCVLKSQEFIIINFQIKITTFLNDLYLTVTPYHQALSFPKHFMSFNF